MFSETVLHFSRRSGRLRLSALRLHSTPVVSLVRSGRRDAGSSALTESVPKVLRVDLSEKSFLRSDGLSEAASDLHFRERQQASKLRNEFVWLSIPVHLRDLMAHSFYLDYDSTKGISVELFGALDAIDKLAQGKLTASEIHEWFADNRNSLNECVHYCLKSASKPTHAPAVLAFINEFELLPLLDSDLIQSMTDLLVGQGMTHEVLSMLLAVDRNAMDEEIHESIGMTLCGNSWTDSIHPALFPSIIQWADCVCHQYLSSCEAVLYYGRDDFQNRQFEKWSNSSTTAAFDPRKIAMQRYGSVLKQIPLPSVSDVKTSGIQSLEMGTELKKLVVDKFGNSLPFDGDSEAGSSELKKEGTFESGKRQRELLKMRFSRKNRKMITDSTGELDSLQTDDLSSEMRAFELEVDSTTNLSSKAFSDHSKHKQLALGQFGANRRRAHWSGGALPMCEPLKFECFATYLLLQLSRNNEREMVRELIARIEPMVPILQSKLLEFGIMASYALVGDYTRVWRILNEQFSRNDASVTPLSLHLCILAYFNHFKLDCDCQMEEFIKTTAAQTPDVGDSGISQQTADGLMSDSKSVGEMADDSWMAAPRGGRDLLVVVTDIYKLFPRMGSTATRMTFDLLLNISATCDALHQSRFYAKMHSFAHGGVMKPVAGGSVVECPSMALLIDEDMDELSGGHKKQGAAIVKEEMVGGLEDGQFEDSEYDSDDDDGDGVQTEEGKRGQVQRGVRVVENTAPFGVDYKQCVMQTMLDLAEMQYTRKTRLMYNLGHNFHYKLTSRTFSALVQPYVANGVRDEAEYILGYVTRELLPGSKGLKARRDWTQLFDSFAMVDSSDFGGGLQPYLYSFHVDFADSFPHLRVVEPFRKLFSTMGSMRQRRKALSEQSAGSKLTDGNEQSKPILRNRHLDKSWLSQLGDRNAANGEYAIPDKEYKSGVSKFKGVKRFKERRRVERKMLGKGGKFHKKTNPRH